MDGGGVVQFEGRHIFEPFSRRKMLAIEHFSVALSDARLRQQNDGTGDCITDYQRRKDRLLVLSHRLLRVTDQEEMQLNAVDDVKKSPRYREHRFAEIASV